MTCRKSNALNTILTSWVTQFICWISYSHYKGFTKSIVFSTADTVYMIDKLGIRYILLIPHFTLCKNSERYINNLYVCSLIPVVISIPLNLPWPPVGSVNLCLTSQSQPKSSKEHYSDARNGFCFTNFLTIKPVKLRVMRRWLVSDWNVLLSGLSYKDEK